ncbi:MAG: hypothetical protein LBB91_05270, partial [Clostridiales bacterium]|nr:hypothetical protein [Clostridiales bacterium]
EIGSVREILSLTLNDPFLTNGLAEALSLIVFALPGLLDPKGSGLSSAQSLADVLKAAGILGDLIKYDPMLKAAILETLYELASQGKFGKIAEFLSNPVVIAGVTAIAPIVPITAFLLIELAEDVIGSIAGFLGKVGTTLDFALKFMELLEKAIAAAVDGVTHILEKMQAGFADFMAGLGDLVKRGEAFAVQKAQEFFGGVKDGLNSVMSFLGDVVEGSGKFCSGMVQIASDLAVSTIEGAKVVSNQVIEAIGSAAQSIGGAIVKAFDAVENGIDKIASGIHNVIDTSGAGGPIADIAHIAIDTIQSLEEGALEFLKKAVSFSADGVSSVTKEIQTWSNSFLNGLEDKVKKGTDFVLQQAEAFFSAAKDTLQNITAFMEKVVDKTGAFVVKAAQTLSGLASRAIENVTDAVNNVFDGIETKVQEAGAVIVNAFKDVRGKIDGVATSIIGTLSNAIKGLLQPSQDKNLDVVEEVSLEQAKTGVELINDVVRKLALFIENFESQIQSLAAVAIEKVHSPFLEFKLIIKELTLGSQPIITRSVSDSVSISGGGAAIANVGSGRIAVNFGELRKVRSYAEALLNELKARVSAASRARSAANAATREYDQSYVRSDASATLTACSNLERDDRAVSEELSELMRGIDQVIEGYERLERDLA